MTTPTVHEQIGSLISAELLALLAAHFPLRCPSMTESDRRIWAEVGRQDLLAFLNFCRVEYQTPQQQPEPDDVLQ